MLKQPLAGIRVIDFGAEVPGVRRPSELTVDPRLGMARGEDNIKLDLFHASGFGLAKDLTRNACAIAAGVAQAA